MSSRAGSQAQGDLFEPPRARSTEELKHDLAVRSGRSLCLKVTRNRSSMVSLSSRGHDAPVSIRVHEAFLQAPEQVIQALAKYLKRPRRADWKVVADFAQTIGPAAGDRPRSVPPSQGNVIDLEELSRRVNQRFFQGRLRCSVGWAPERPRSPRAPKRRSIRYGSYLRDTDSIRIHPLLDDARVPEVFVEYILYHEMLHSVVPPERRNGRWLYHPPAFRHLDRRFPDWQRMQRLGKELLHRLG